MEITHHLQKALPAALVLFLLGSHIADGQPPGHESGLHGEVESVVAQIESLRVAGLGDSALAVLEHAIKTAILEKDDYHRTELSVHKGRMLVSLGRGKEAEAILDKAIVSAASHRDTALWCEALMQQCFAVDAQGRPPRAVPIYQELRRLGIAFGDSVYMAQADLMIARREMRGGEVDAARERLMVGLQVFRAANNETSELNALHLLGLADARSGNLMGARRYWLQSQKLARELGNKMMEAGALNNIGAIEYRVGDPGIAVEQWKTARQLYLANGRMRSAIFPGINSADVLRALGRYDEAVALFEEQRVLCREQGYTDLEAQQLIGLGAIALAQEHYGEAADLYREALNTLGPEPELESLAYGTNGLARALAGRDSLAAAIDLVASTLSNLGSRLHAFERLSLEIRLAELYIENDEPERAVVFLPRAERDAAANNLKQRQLEILAILGGALVTLGQPDRALVRLEQAAQVWEEQRGVPMDPDWREQRGSQGVLIYTDLASLYLRDPEHGLQKAIDLLQRFKARTLLEGMEGPLASQPDTARPKLLTSLDQLQEDVLTDEELLLDSYLGPRTSLLFAITRSEARVVRLPGLEDLGSRLELYQSLLASRPPTDRDRAGLAMNAIQAAGDSLGDLLFADLGDLLASHERILFVPDGALNIIPLATLSFAGSGQRTPLAMTHEIIRFPSATVLAWLRSPSRQLHTSQDTRLLALAGHYQHEQARLEGATQEVRSLSRRFENVELAIDPDPQRGWPAEDDLDDFEILHVAAHTVVDDQRPWRSGVVLSASEAFDPDPEGTVRLWEMAPTVLEASRIRELDLSLQMVVLSGCESAGGRVLSGEGVLGLTSAFLSSGVPTVVASLWQVDDRSTVQLMESFYDHLADGRSASTALRQAQNTLRQNSRTSHPFYWAAFVLVGEGGTKTPLERRTSWTLILFLAVVSLLILFYVLRRIRQDTPSGN